MSSSKQFPEPVLKELKKLANDVLKEVAASDPMSQKVYDSVLSFQKNHDRLEQAD